MNVPMVRKESIPAMTRQELIEVLRNSLYPGAQDSSIEMVLGYCDAASLDVMQKPVHLVPMWDSKTRAMRDVVMPGIGLYRTQAARSGTYAGVSEPEFGPDVTESVGGFSMTYPAWCRVVVKRLLPNDMIVEFCAVERWKENYATAGKDSQAPNSMWKKRPYGQIAKCAEAQALRKAFPEFGAQPTADEMEGKSFEEVEKEINPAPTPKELPAYTDEKLDEILPTWQAAVNAKTNTAQGIINKVSTKYTLSEEQKRRIKQLEAIEPEPETTNELPPENAGEEFGENR